MKKGGEESKGKQKTRTKKEKKNCTGRTINIKKELERGIRESAETQGIPRKGKPGGGSGAGGLPWGGGFAVSRKYQ